MTTLDQHRAFGVALLSQYADVLLDRAAEACDAIGLVCDTPENEAFKVACRTFATAFYARYGVTAWCLQLTVRDVLALTIVEIKS